MISKLYQTYFHGMLTEDFSVLYRSTKILPNFGDFLNNSSGINIKCRKYIFIFAFEGGLCRVREGDDI